MQEADIKQLTNELVGRPAEEVIAFLGKLGPKVAFASSLGLEDQVVTAMIARHAPAMPIFTIDTGRLPEESYEVIEATEAAYGVKIEVLFPDRQEVESMVAEHGPNLFYRGVENRRLCCHVRKVNVLRRRLAGLSAWVCGLRREQSVTRADVGLVQWDEGNGLAKVNPLFDWTLEQVWRYIRDNHVPYNRLHDRGYPSIGCQPCTRAVEPGQDVRAGRWWWEEPEHKECGLHVVDGKLVRKKKS